jgi:ferredoxin--NADP+ reductase
MVLEDIGRGAGKAGRPGLDTLLASRGVAPVTFRDWRRIEEAEVRAALDGNPREKFVTIEAMLEALGR